MMSVLVLMAALGSIFIIIGAKEHGEKLLCITIALAVVLPALPVLFQSLVASIPHPELSQAPWTTALMIIGYVACTVLLFRWWMRKRTKSQSKHAEHDRARTRERARVYPPLPPGGTP